MLMGWVPAVAISPSTLVADTVLWHEPVDMNEHKYIVST